MIISIDAEKAFNKIQHQFYDKNSPENRHRWNLPQHNSEIMTNPQPTEYSMVKN